MWFRPAVTWTLNWTPCYVICQVPVKRNTYLKYQYMSCALYFDQEILYAGLGNVILIIYMYIGTSIFLIIGILQPPTTKILAVIEDHFSITVEFEVSIQTGVTVRKRPIWVYISDFCSVWPWNLTDDLEKIGYLFYATLSFVHHATAINEFKLELQTWNAKIESNSTSFLSRATLKFDRWPLKTIGQLFPATSSFVHHFVAIGQFKLKLQSEFGGWSLKTIGPLFYATPSFAHHFTAINEI